MDEKPEDSTPPHSVSMAMTKVSLRCLSFSSKKKGPFETLGLAREVSEHLRFGKLSAEPDDTVTTEKLPSAVSVSLWVNDPLPMSVLVLDRGAAALSLGILISAPTVGEISLEKLLSDSCSSEHTCALGSAQE